MRHRIFIAINLPEEIKKELINYQARWPELPIRWTKREKLHITLVFIGYISDEEVLESCRVTKEVASRYPSFSINLNKICYGPPKKMPPRSTSVSRSFHRSPHSSAEGGVPKMIWVKGEKLEELANLKDDLEKSLSEKIRLALSQKEQGRAFSPHITLGRIRAWEWRTIEPEERPKVEEEIDLSFEVNSIEVMESKLKKGGAEYTILESVPLSS